MENEATKNYVYYSLHTGAAVGKEVTVVAVGVGIGKEDAAVVETGGEAGAEIGEVVVVATAGAEAETEEEAVANMKKDLDHLRYQGNFLFLICHSLHALCLMLVCRNSIVF